MHDGGRARFDWALVIFCIAGITVLSHLSAQTAAVAVPFADIPLYEHRQVIVRGMVEDIHLIQDSAVIELRDNTGASLDLFLEQTKTYYTIGDELEAHGRVERYHGAYEVIVSGDHAITLCAHWNDTALSVRQLAAQPMVYDGLPVCVHAFVDRTSQSWCTISDRCGENQLHVIGDVAAMAKNNEVLLAGVFSYDDDFGYALHLTSWTLIAAWDV